MALASDSKFLDLKSLKTQKEPKDALKLYLDYKYDSTFLSCEQPKANSKRLQQELQKAILLKKVSDQKFVYLFEAFAGSVVMQELGRLREISFRMVGEGTGNDLDLDIYDMHYYHLVLWDDAEKAIMGSYRLGGPKDQCFDNNFSSLYSASLFDYKDSMNEFVSNGLEMGRSFLQPKYWGSRGLDYMWKGIGVILKNNPNIRYLYGLVSISGSMPNRAKELLVAYYQSYYQLDRIGYYATAKNKYHCSYETVRYIAREYPTDRVLALALLKRDLNSFGVSIPTMYKQYADLCEPEGVRFLDFGVDHSFNDAIDGFIVIDLKFLKKSKRIRFMSA